MMKIIRHILLIAFLLAAPALRAQNATATAATADQIVQQFLGKVEKQTLTASFAITISEGSVGQPAGSGTIRMRGRRFLLDMLATEAAFDGRTLYTYQEDTEELTLTDPAEEELADVNPILFAEALRKASTVRFTASDKDPKCYSIEFIPTDKTAGIRRFVLKLRKADLTPVEIRIQENKQQTLVRFTAAAFSQEMPVFKLEKKGAYVNDMR